MKREDKDTQHLNVHLAVENFGPIEKAEYRSASLNRVCW